jgi:hypothetical protein
MGDEFRAPNPFPFFCDFSGELGLRWRKGAGVRPPLFGDAFPSPCRRR